LETESLLAGSPALGTGLTTGATAADERGLPRVVNGKIDVGAFETQPPPPVVAPTPPVAAADSFSVAQDGALAGASVLANDTGGAAPLTARLVAGPTHAASFTLNADGTFAYVPRPGFFGTDSFTYQAVGADGAASNPVAVTLQIVPQGTPNQVYVRSLFGTLLQRSVDTATLAAASGLLDQGFSRTTLVQSIENSAEYRGDLVQSLYQRFLHRAADAPGVQSGVAFLAAGGTVEQLQALLVGSQEYFQLHGGTNQGFVAALYQDALGRPIDPGALNALTQLLAGGASRSVIAASIFRSPEYLADLARADYQAFLGRPADPAGLAGIVQALQAGITDQTIVSILLGSPEAFAKLS
jgi:hypothetical protein